MRHAIKGNFAADREFDLAGRVGPISWVRGLLSGLSRSGTSTQ